MVSRIDIGPDGGPYVEIDESNGDLVIRTPNNNVDFNDEALLNIASVAVDSLTTNNDASIDFSNDDLTNIGTASVASLEAESLIIGGTLYEEDDNSPFDVSSSQEATYNVAGDYEQIILIPDPGIVGHNQLRINGDDNENYDYLFNDDTQTSNQTEWEIPRPSGFEYLNISVKRGDNVRFATALQDRESGSTIAGRNDAQDEINSVTLLDDSSRDAKFRVFGRSMDI